MRKNFMLIAMLVATFVFTAPMTAKAEEVGGKWHNSDNGLKYEENGSYYKDGFYVIDEKTYYFDADGYMATEWKQIDENWYYFGADGVMATDWKLINGVWYYLEPDSGVMYSNGLLCINEELFIFEKSGACVTTPGWHKRYGDWYYLTGNGALTIGWEVIAGKYYCFSGAGWMYANGWNEVEGKNWLFDENGVWKGATGWNWANNSWYYLFDWHTCAEGWELINGDYYWFENDEDFYDYGQMHWGGSREIEGQTYFFKNNGARVSGWHNYADAYDKYPSWIYCNTDGTPYSGWVASNGSWYYIYEGYMNTGRLTDDTGKEYYLGRDGRLVYGWYYAEYKDDTGYYEGQWYYTDPKTGEIYDGWLNDGGKWYYISSGMMCYAEIVHDYKNQPQWEDFDYNKDGIFDEEEYWTYEAVYEAWSKKAWILGTDGVIVSGGWYTFTSTYGTTWYYANADGTVYDGWLNYGGAWYYIEMGEMVTNQYMDGRWIGADGVWR